MDGGRGGYCYEQNILFGTVLARLGFRVANLAARMLMGEPETTTRAAGHAVLSVDVGSMELMRIADRVEMVHEGGWRYRMDRAAAAGGRSRIAP